MIDLQKGMSQNEVMKLLDEDPLEEFTIDFNGEKILVSKFHMQIGTRTIQTRYRDSQGNTHRSTTIEPVFADFVFSFKKDRLVYWGFIQEYRKDPNRNINELGKAINDYDNQPEELIDVE